MENKYLSYQLAASLGTPSFYNLLGDLLMEESNSNKLIIVRADKERWIILDSKGYNPKKLDYDTLEELTLTLEDIKMLKFPFNTYILFDGKFEDKILLKMLMMLFEKEESIYEKYRLEMVIDRLSYQLSGIENIVKIFSKKIKEEDFLDTMLGIISEIFFSTAGIYEQNKLIKKNGKLMLPEDIEIFDTMSKLEKGKSCNIMNLSDSNKAYYNVFNIKYIIPYLKEGVVKYLLVISRDTPFEKEEAGVLETIQKITQFFFEENAI